MPTIAGGFASYRKRQGDVAQLKLAARKAVLPI
jgi:hypothetical protein